MAATDWKIDFPTLGYLWDAWVSAHCTVPGGFNVGKPLTWSDWQFWVAANYGRIKKRVKYTGEFLGADAFHYSRALVVAPQKTGKGPWAATMTLLHAVGPVEFAGWAKAGDSYRCADHGCPCGFVFQYQPGEPMGVPHPSPLIQLVAASEDQVSNTYDPVRSMAASNEDLQEQLQDRQGFIRIKKATGSKDANRVDVVSSSARSRLGNPITFAVMDETGTWTKNNKLMEVADAVRRGLAGMRGRSIETTNAWDSSENSVAQRTFSSASGNTFVFYELPPGDLTWEKKSDRRKILEAVYAGSPWVSIDAVLKEANEISETNPAQAERFFGNKIIQGIGGYLPEGLWEACYAGV